MKKRPIIGLGDVHGNFQYIKDYILRNHMCNCDILQVGDFGVGFIDQFEQMNVLGDLNAKLRENNIHMWIWRGNHSDPSYFDGHLTNYFSNLHLMEDYTVITLDGTRILGVGGAISIDRNPRMSDERQYAKIGKQIDLYFRDESFKLDEEKLRLVEDIDILVTHTTPDFCFPDNKNGFGMLVESYAKEDSKLIDDLKEERINITKMWNIFKEKNNPKFHLYGHYHRTWHAEIDGCEHRCLGINEFFDLRIDYMEEMNEKYK